MAAAVARRAEIKTRTTDEVKRSATEVYARFDYASGSTTSRICASHARLRASVTC